MPRTHFEQIPIAEVKVAHTRDNRLEKKIGPPPLLIEPARALGKRGQP